MNKMHLSGLYTQTIILMYTYLSTPFFSSSQGLGPSECQPDRSMWAATSQLCCCANNTLPPIMPS